MLGRLHALCALAALAGCAEATARGPDGGEALSDAADAAPASDRDADGADAAAIDAASVDATPLSTADAAPLGPDAGCTPTWINLLDNPGFEAGDASWTATTGVIDGTGTPFAPYAGMFHARLGGTNDEADTLAQPVIVPADATALRLRGYRCYVTSDTTPGADAMAIELRNGGGAVLEALASYPNEDVDAVCSWNPFALDIAGDYAGQTITLAFDAATDGASPTSWVVDQLALEAMACP